MRQGATISDRRMLDIDSPGALAEFVGVDAGLVHQRNHQVRERRALCHPDVTISLVLPCAAADEQRRQVLVIVLVAVGHAAAVQEQRVIQQVPVAVWCRLQLVQELCEEIEVDVEKAIVLDTRGRTLPMQATGLTGNLMGITAVFLLRKS